MFTKPSAELDRFYDDPALLRLIAPVEGDAWSRQPNESESWYDKFYFFLCLGTGRTVDRAYLNYAKEKNAVEGNARSKPRKGYVPKRAPSTWLVEANKSDWRSRALAHDAAVRRELMRAEISDRFIQRRQRLRELDLIRKNTFAGLVAVDLSGLAADDLYTLYPAIRQLYMDAVKAQRLEYGEVSEITIDATAEQSTKAAFTADHFAAALEQIDSWQAQLAPAGVPPMPAVDEAGTA